MRKQMEALGFPTPQPATIYVQQYAESLSRILLTMIWAVAARIFELDFMASAGTWASAYVVLVLLLYVLKIPKEFALSNEVELMFRHSVAYLVVFMLVDNGITTLLH